MTITPGIVATARLVGVVTDEDKPWLTHERCTAALRLGARGRSAS